jgi:hypothetical protein
MAGEEETQRRAGEKRPALKEVPRAADVNANAQEPEAEEAHNPLATWLGFLVVVALLLGTWFVINQINCDPLFSDAGLSHSRACR